MSQLEPTNRPINHIAISCTDIEELIKWYTNVLGFEIIGDIQHCSRAKDPTPFETIFVSYSPLLQELKFAILTTGNGTRVEGHWEGGLIILGLDLRDITGYIPRTRGVM
uniref:Glyoxalase/fosfomycin resistance/dioxygenase domain-containing protein n=1 Tax=Fusarium oxysporum (strain Fo5176) TaxID=660025 RepID=A0A0D2Y1L0_FUSOF